MWKQVDNDTEIFEIPDLVEAAKKDLALASREELLKKVHVFQGSDAHRKAAILLLADMDKKDSEKKHRNLFIIAALTLLVAVLTLVAQITGFSMKQFLGSPNTRKPTQGVATNRQIQKKESNSDVPRQIAPHEPIEKQGTNNIKTK